MSRSHSCRCFILESYEPLSLLPFVVVVVVVVAAVVLLMEQHPSAVSRRTIAESTDDRNMIQLEKGKAYASQFRTKAGCWLQNGIAWRVAWTGSHQTSVLGRILTIIPVFGTVDIPA